MTTQAPPLRQSGDTFGGPEWYYLFKIPLYIMSWHCGLGTGLIDLCTFVVRERLAKWVQQNRKGNLQQTN
jgi:hypothetical protein